MQICANAAVYYMTLPGYADDMPGLRGFVHGIDDLNTERKNNCRCWQPLARLAQQQNAHLAPVQGNDA